MEDVLGGWTDPTRFAAFLADWEPILARRVDEAVAAFSAIDGVRGLILAGGVGRGEPWPLSDIDFLTISDDDRAAEVRAEVARRSVTLHARWLDEGWWTGLDIGKLGFDRREVARVLGSDDPTLAELLQDDRWYHSLDKGYQGRPVFDVDGDAGKLSRWFSAQRFSLPVVRCRLARERREVEEAHQQLVASLDRGDVLAGTTALRAAAKWLPIWLLEQWGERDASLARVGTRFDEMAGARGRPDLVDLVNSLNDLDEGSVERRMAGAPAWVWEWHNRSWRARQQVGEAVTPLQHARDVLRVCTQFELRRVTERPGDPWLAFPVTVEVLNEKARLLSELLSDDRLPT